MYKVTTSPDLNTLIGDGVYLIGTSSINAPDGTTSHGILFVFGSVGTKCQFFIVDNQAYLYKRWFNNATLEWRGWYKSTTFAAV